MKSRQGMTTFCYMKRTSKHPIRCCFSGGDWSHRVLDLKNLCRKHWLLPWRFVAAQHVIYQSYILLTTWYHRQLSFWPYISTVAWLHSVFLPNKREVTFGVASGRASGIYKKKKNLPSQTCMVAPMWIRKQLKVVSVYFVTVKLCLQTLPNYPGFKLKTKSFKVQQHRPSIE